MIAAVAILLGLLSAVWSMILYRREHASVYKSYAIIGFVFLIYLLFKNNNVLTDGIPTEFASAADLFAGFVLFAAVFFSRKIEENLHREVQRVQESEEKYRGLIERSFDMIFTLDLNGKISYVSPACERMLGFRNDELQHAELKDLLREEDNITLSKAFDNILKHRSNVGMTLDMQKKDSAYATLEFYLSPVFKNGKIIGVQGIARDVTETRRTEKKLRESEERLWAIASATPFPIEITNGESKVLYVNEAYCELVGRRFESLIGQPTPILHSKQHASLYQKLRYKEKIKNFESYIQKHDGTKIWISGAIQKITFDEHPAYLTGFVDITQRKKVEEALRESEKRFKELFKSSPNAIFVKDMHGNVLDVNPAACRLHRINRRELIGMNDADLLASGGKFDTLRNYQKLLNGKKDYFEGLINTKDHKSIPVEIRANKIHYLSKPAVLLHVSDISERKQLEEKLLHAQKMEAIGKLAGGIAHDFNNLLTAITSYTDLILSNIDSEDPIKQDVEEIQKAGERAAMLTRQLLAFGKKQMLSPEAINLNETVKDLLNMLKRVIGENIELKISLLPGLKMIWADVSQIQQVVLNLCINARDAMPKGGTLSIKTRNVTEADILNHRSDKPSTQEFVELQIVDTGVGIDRKVQQRIFEPFFTTKEVNKGTGLGLSVVYGIVKQHKGIIHVDSTLGKGTAFKLYFPVKNVSKTSRATKEEEMTNLCGTETILVVEDDSAVRKVALRILSGMGYKTLTAANGMEALKIFERKKDEIDLVVMDVVMPKFSGPDTYRKLSRVRPHLPVIFVTGYDVNSEIKDSDFMENTYVNLLQKPYTKESLTKKIRELLGTEYVKSRI